MIYLFVQGPSINSREANSSATKDDEIVEKSDEKAEDEKKDQ